MEEYYKAYEERYKTAHEKGISWSWDVGTPIVMEVLERYRIRKDQALLELGCGEGRDARRLLEAGYSLMATDVSEEAIRYCREQMPACGQQFQILDFLQEDMGRQFDFIYAVAVIHMLVPDEDRDGFYQFIRRHLNPGGIALICSMGNGAQEMQSDISQAFTLQEREHESGPILVAATSCRMVTFDSFEVEIKRNALQILETGLTEAPPEFNQLMYAVVTV